MTPTWRPSCYLTIHCLLQREAACILWLVALFQQRHHSDLCLHHPSPPLTLIALSIYTLTRHQNLRNSVKDLSGYFGSIQILQDNGPQLLKFKFLWKVSVASEVTHLQM